MFKMYKEKIDLVGELITLEKVPTKNPNGLATMMVLTTEYGAGDALAGMLLYKVLDSPVAQESLRRFCKSAMGVEYKKISWLELSHACEKLGEKYRVFKELNLISLSGGRMNNLQKIKVELENQGDKK